MFWGLYDNPPIFICSGALITDKHVLVSAKCANSVMDAFENMHNHAEIRMGNHNVDAIKRNIVRVYRHENSVNYDYKHFGNMSNEFDIGILKMDRPVSFGPNVQPICLPQSPEFDYSGKRATAIGLYDTGNIWNRRRSKAQQSNIPIWKKCYHKYHIPDSVVCAGDYQDAAQRAHIRDVR